MYNPRQKKTQMCRACRVVLPCAPAHWRVTGTSTVDGHKYATRCLRCEATPPVDAFAETQAALEAAYGPYATWSRAVHHEHNKRMYAALGWSPEGEIPVPDVPGALPHVRYRGGAVTTLARPTGGPPRPALDPASPHFRPHLHTARRSHG
jgi:hypothetical protein